jgi:hypothetical protein
MRDGEAMLGIGRRTMFGAALAVTALGGCSRAQWGRAFDPAPSSPSAATIVARQMDCQPLLTRATTIIAVPGDSLTGAAAVRTNIAYSLAMSDYSTCMARAAMP